MLKARVVVLYLRLRGVQNVNLAVCILLFVVSGLGLHPAMPLVWGLDGL